MLKKVLLENHGLSITAAKNSTNYNYQSMMVAALIAGSITFGFIWWFAARPITHDQLQVLSIVIAEHADSTGIPSEDTWNEICLRYGAATEYHLNQIDYHKALDALTLSVRRNQRTAS